MIQNIYIVTNFVKIKKFTLSNDTAVEFTVGEITRCLYIGLSVLHFTWFEQTWLSDADIDRKCIYKEIKDKYHDHVHIRLKF